MIPVANPAPPVAWQISATEIVPGNAVGEIYTIPDGWEPFAVTERLVWIRRRIAADGA